MIHVTKPGRELVAFVVKRRGDYFIAGSDESGPETSTNAEDAHRWTIGPWTKDVAYDLAAAVARRWKGRVVGITVPGKLRQAKPRRVRRKR